MPIVIFFIYISTLPSHYEASSIIVWFTVCILFPQYTYSMGYWKDAVGWSDAVRCSFSAQNCELDRGICQNEIDIAFISVILKPEITWKPVAFTNPISICMKIGDEVTCNHTDVRNEILTNIYGCKICIQWHEASWDTNLGRYILLRGHILLSWSFKMVTWDILSNESDFHLP